MENFINKLLLVLAVLAMLGLMPSKAFAGSEIRGVFNASSSGTTSATVFVDSSTDFPQITDLSWKLDAGVTTGTITFRSGDIKYSSTSATSASGTVVWFANAATSVAVGEYIIIRENGSYFLRQVTAATTTSVTVSESISSALTTSSLVWAVNSSTSTRYAPQLATPTSPYSAVSIWLPKERPTAITVDGNTTACRISVSGNYSNYK